MAATRSNVGLWLGFLTAALSALALGALWSLLELRFGYEISWFSLICAYVIARILRAYGFVGMKTGAFIAAACVAVACFYSQCLLAIADVAQSLGISLREAIAQIGVAFTFAAARARIGTLDLVVFAVAVLVAAALVMFRRRAKTAET